MIGALKRLWRRLFPPVQVDGFVPPPIVPNPHVHIPAIHPDPPEPLSEAEMSDPEDIIPREIVFRMFPYTDEKNIVRYLPDVWNGLRKFALTDADMALVALSSIRAETESFVPVSEGISRYNTSPGGHPFNLYDHRAALGNLGPPDGAMFKGRGFPQLTGRYNYDIIGKMIGVDLVKNPEAANKADVSGMVLAAFLKTREQKIRMALMDGDLARARRLFNGGTHGIDRFVEAMQVGRRLINIRRHGEHA